MRNLLVFFLVINSLLSIAQQNTKKDSLTVLISNCENQKQKAKLLLKRSKTITNTETENAYNDAILALEIAKNENDKVTQIDALAQVSTIYSLKENFQKALEFDAQILMLSEKENDIISKINAYKNMSRNQKAIGDIKSAVKSAEKAKEVALENNLSQELASINNALGVAYRNNNEFNKSLNSLNEGLTQTNNKKLLALLHMNKANTLTELMKLDEAIESHLESLKINEQLNDSRGKQQVYNNLGTLFKKAKQYEKSIYYYRKSLKIAEENKSKLSIGLAYDNLATLYDLSKKKDSIIWYRKNAISIFESVKDEKNTARSYHNLGVYQLLNNKFKEAEQNLKIALQKRNSINVPIDIASTKTNLGIVYDKLNQFDKAEILLLDANELLKNVSTDKKEEFLQAFSNHYKLKGDFATALDLKEQQLNLKDSLIHKNEIITVLKQENDFVVNNKNKKIKKLESVENNLNKSKIIYGILVFLVFILALYSFIRWKKSDYSKKKVFSEKQEIEKQKQEIETEHSVISAELKKVKKLVLEDYLILKNNNKIYLNELIYIVSEDHYLEIHTSTKKEIIRGSISEILSQLPPNFSQTHRSYIVNRNYIYKINNNNLVLKNNTTIPLTRKFKKDFDY